MNTGTIMLSRCTFNVDLAGFVHIQEASDGASRQVSATVTNIARVSLLTLNNILVYISRLQSMTTT